MDNLWGEVAQKSLQWANALVDSETAPTAATVETVRGLVEIAIALSKVGDGMPIRSCMRCVLVFKNGKVKIEKR